MHGEAGSHWRPVQFGPDATPGLWWCKRRHGADADPGRPPMATTKLNDTHLAILTQAAQRPKFRVLPTPESLKADGGAVARALKTLLKRGLIAEEPARRSDSEWRRDDDGARLTLAISPAGLAAIDVAEPVASSPAEGAAHGPEKKASVRDINTAAPPPTAQRPGTKGAEITALLKRNGGATLDELTAATGWQAHSVRGFLSGALKKKLGYCVTSERSGEGARRYRIAA
jgi:hypothetical protein